MARAPHSILIALALLLAGTLPGWADDDDHRRARDHEIAKQALQRGEILPLETVLLEVRKTEAGEFIGVELDRKQGEWVYAVKMLSPKGTLVRIRVDARTGKILQTKKKD